MFQFMSVMCGLFCLILMCGCGNRHDGETGNKIVRFWHIMNYSGPKEVLEDAVRRFEASHPGVRVDMQAFSNDDYKTKLALEMASGTEPDVFFCWGAGGQTGRYIAQGRVRALDDFAEKNGWKGRFLESAEELCRKDGKLYCAPLDLSVVVLWCNQELFQKHEIQIPKTWTEFVATCKNFQKKGVTPLALGNLDAWPGAFYFCYLANRLGGTQLFKDAAAGKDGRNFSAEAFVKAGDMTRGLAGYFNADYAERREDEARKMFVRGRAAMYLGGSWLVGQLVAKPENREFLKHLIPVTFPRLPEGEGDPKTLLGGVNCGFAVAMSSQQPQLAMELLDCLTDATTAEAWCKIGRIPALKVQQHWLEALPKPSRQVYGLLTDSTGLQPYYDQYLEATLTVTHKNTTRDLLKGRITGAQAAEKMTGAAK